MGGHTVELGSLDEQKKWACQRLNTSLSWRRRAQERAYLPLMEAQLAYRKKRAACQRAFREGSVGERESCEEIDRIRLAYQTKFKLILFNASLHSVQNWAQFIGGLAKRQAQACIEGEQEKASMGSSSVVR